VVGRLCDRTGELRVLREQVSLGYGSVYMRIRPLLLALGDRLVATGHVDRADDIFMLTLDELRRAVHGNGADPDVVRARVAGRRAEASAAGDLALPDVVIGDGFVPEIAHRTSLSEVRGSAASAGRHTGRLRVLASVGEGHRLLPGDVMAVETSDVTWTALFGRAGAVLAESGGLLSHAAVVAREKGIPCVASADGCTRLPDGAEVEVDGYAGVVRVLA
jgi:pyruvate,water dikinase